MDSLWAAKSEGVGLSVHAISFQDFHRKCSWSTNVTDGQTDGRTTCNRITALCTIVHRAVTTTTTTTFLREQQCSTPVPHLAYKTYFLRKYVAYILINYNYLLIFNSDEGTFIHVPSLWVWFVNIPNTTIRKAHKQWRVQLKWGGRGTKARRPLTTLQAGAHFPAFLLKIHIKAKVHK